MNVRNEKLLQYLFHLHLRVMTAPVQHPLLLHLLSRCWIKIVVRQFEKNTRTYRNSTSSIVAADNPILSILYCSWFVSNIFNKFINSALFSNEMLPLTSESFTFIEVNNSWKLVNTFSKAELQLRKLSDIV